MQLDGPRTEGQRRRDVLVRPALGAQRQNLALAPRQRFGVAPGGGNAVGLEEGSDLVHERRPGGLAGQQDVVPAVERHEARARDRRGDLDGVGERHRPIARGLEDERRRPDRGQVGRDVDAMPGDPARDRVRGRRRHPLEVVEPAQLLLGRLRDELRGEDAPELRVLLRPADADHAPVRLLLGFSVRVAHGRAAADRPVEHEARHAVRVHDRVRPCDGRTAGHPEEREPPEADRLDHGLEIPQTRLDREVVDVPVGHPEAALVVPDERRERTEVVQEMPPDGALPVVLEVAQPAGGDDEGRPGPMDGVGQPRSVTRAAEADLLVDAGRAPFGS